jgi:CheY-like chemotaxis protein
MNEKILHICIAEDDPDDYYLFSRFMKEIDKNVKLTWFKTCEDLLDFLKTGSDLPNLIVLDMNMPKMDGQACLSTIKGKLSLQDIPVIIFSTAGEPTTIKTAYASGALKYYLKPHSIEDYRKIIRQILDVPF